MKDKLKEWGSKALMVLMMAFMCSGASALAFNEATVMDGKPMAVALLACLLMAPATMLAEKGRKKLMNKV